MSPMTVLYFADISGGISGLFVILASLSFVAAVITLVNHATDDTPGFSRPGAALIVSCIIFSLAGILIPSKNTIYMMFSVDALQQVAATPEAKEIGNKLLKLANQKLDEAISKK